MIHALETDMIEAAFKRQDAEAVGLMDIVCPDDWEGLLVNLARALSSGDSRLVRYWQSVLTATLEEWAYVPAGTWEKLLKAGKRK